MKHSTPVATSRIPSLDGLRAVALCGVLATHLGGSRYFLKDSYLGPFDLGNLGVRIFFVISGFLITSLLMNELRDTGRVSLRMFYLRRTLRIFPAFYVFLLVMAILALTHAISFRPGDMLHAVTYTTNYHYDRSWWLGHAWSLSIEEQFYLLWPAVFALAGIKRAMGTAGAVVLLCPLIRTILLVMYPGTHAWMGELFPTVADGLATGCLLAGFRDQLADRTWYRSLLNFRWFNLVPAFALLLNCYPGGRLRGAIIQTAINVCIAVTIDRYTRMPQTATGRLLNWRPLSFLGVLSYSVYLWQQPFLHHDQSFLPFPANVLLVFVAASLSYKFVELPFLKLRKRIEHYIASPSLSAVAHASACSIDTRVDVGAL